MRLEYGHFPGLTLHWAYRQESFVRRDNLTPVALIDYDLAVRSLKPEESNLPVGACASLNAGNTHRFGLAEKGDADAWGPLRDALTQALGIE